MRSDVRQGRQLATSGRDRMDAVIDSWRRELPDFDRPTLELVKRAGRLGQLLEEALSRCLAPWKLAKVHYNVLWILRIAGPPYELRPTDIRNQLLLTSGGVAGIINRLEQMRLVQRIPDQVDGRSSWVRLTDDGIEVAEETIRAWSTVQEQMLDGVDPQFAQQASDMLRTILLALGDREPPAPAARQDARP
jgi:DNA-binding MarR family transcriptional regulator